MKRVFKTFCIVFSIALSGCYAGPLTPQASSAVTQSAATGDPSAIIMERSSVYGSSVGQTIASIGGPPNQVPVVIVESRAERRARLEDLEYSNEMKLVKAEQDVAELQKGW